MSYREENDQVILTMSRDDYAYVTFALGIATGHMLSRGEKADGIFELLNRLNEGNPHYTPYQVEARDHD